MRLLKVLFLPADDGGCGNHRVRMWDTAFRRLKIADSLLINTDTDEKEVREAIESADIVVARLNTLPYIKIIKNNWPDKIVIFDHDDNTLEVKPSNPSYKDFGTMDVWVKTEDYKKTEFYKKASIGVQLKIQEKGALPLWVTGITPEFNRYANLENQVGLLYALTACDVATSPTDTLSELWSRYCDNVMTIPNCLDFSYYPDVEVKRKREEGEIRIGWSGGASHSGDWNTVMPVIKELIKEYPKLKLVINGSNFPEHFKEIEKNLEYHAWTKWEAHPYKLKLLDLDIALIPLAEDEDFNKYKSELKMEEFAALKVPIVVKNQLPYSSYIQDKKNCMAYGTSKELKKALQTLINDKKLRKELATNAYAWVRENRDIDDIAPRVVEAYKQLLPQRIQKEIE